MSKLVSVTNTLGHTYRGRHCEDKTGNGYAPGETVEVSEEAAAYLIETHGFARVAKPAPQKRTRKRATRGASPE